MRNFRQATPTLRYLISVQPLINEYIGKFGQIYLSKSYVIIVYATNKAFIDIMGNKMQEASKNLSENCNFRLLSSIE